VVEGEAVELDDQAPIRPGRVDLEAGDVAVDQRWRQTGLSAEIEELSLELGAGLGHGPEAVRQQGFEGLESMSPSTSLAQSADCVQIEQVLPVGLVEGSLESASRKDLGEVEERSRDACDRDSVAHRAIVGIEVADLVQENPGWAAAPAAARGDIDASGRSWAEALKGRRASVTQQRPVTTGEHGPHPAAVGRQAPMAHCVNPAMKGVYPACRHATADRSSAQAERLELTMGHNSVLTCRDLGDP
jgi:hypothetical protein